MSSVLDVFVQRSTIIQLVQGTFPEDAGKEPDQSRRLMADVPLMYFDRASGRRRTVSLVMGAILVLMATSYTAAAQTPPPPTLKLLPASGESPASTTATGSGFTGVGMVTLTIDEITAGSTTADAGGKFSFGLTIDGSPGAKIVQACQADADGAPCAFTANATFTVNTPPTTTLPPTTTTTTTSTTLPPTTTTLTPTTTTLPATTTSTVVAVAPVAPGTSLPTGPPAPADPDDSGVIAAVPPPSETESVIPELAGIVVLCVIVGGAAALWLRRRKARPAGSRTPPSQTKVQVLAPDGGESSVRKPMQEVKNLSAELPKADVVGGEKGGTSDMNIGIGELQEIPGTDLTDIGAPESAGTADEPRIVTMEDDPTTEPARNESGEKGGTSDMNIGVGELQESPGTDLQDIGAPEAEAEGWDPVEKEKIEGRAEPPAESTGGDADKGQEPGTDLTDIG